MRFPRIAIAAAMCLLAAQAAGLTPAERKLNVDSFEYAWGTIKKFMWEPMPAGVDWQKVHDELEPQVASATTMEQARAVMKDMIARLKMTHFGIVPADVYDRLDAAKGHDGDGSPGFDLRLIDGEPTVISVESDAPSFAAGVRPGWRIVRIGGTSTAELIASLRKALRDSTVKELLVTRAVKAKFDGPVGATIATEFLDGNNRRVTFEIQRKEPRGALSKLGYLPAQHVFYESKRIGNAGYIRFNMFLDPARLTPQFGDSVESCRTCDGMIIDLRGNPGGIGGMSMGMAGWFIDKPDVRLGIMKTKDTELKFTINPRPEIFRGKLVILVDEMTGSTSEIFAGGLKDIGRAHIIGRRTAGAALPSVFEKLPNGDGFQYAIANYVSEGGKPLEGIGVIPDEEVKLTREELLAGHDPALEAALAYIRKQQ
jgi:carboxyl-terminal processing protease